MIIEKEPHPVEIGIVIGIGIDIVTAPGTVMKKMIIIKRGGMLRKEIGFDFGFTFS